MFRKIFTRSDPLDKKNYHWKSNIDFGMAVLGTTIGLSNICRFPALVASYGGVAFVVPYLLFLLVVGVPLQYTQLMLGQYAKLDTTRIFVNMLPLTQGIGWAMTINSALVLLVCNAQTAFAFVYLVTSWQKSLPWLKCDLDMEDCVDFDNLKNGAAKRGNSTGTDIHRFASYHYFGRHIYNDDFTGPSYILGDLNWKLVVGLLVTWSFVYACMWNGLRSIRYVFYVLVPFPFLCIIVLLARCAALPGAEVGVSTEYYFNAKSDNWLQLRTYQTAYTQMCFSLALCTGPLTDIGKYNHYRTKTYWIVLLTTLLDTVVSLIAGLAVFSILGYLQQQYNIDLASIGRFHHDDDTTLAFTIIPLALADLPLPAIFSTFYFAMLIMYGLTTTIITFWNIFIAVRNAIPPRFLPHDRVLLAILCLLFFILGLVFCLTKSRRLVQVIGQSITWSITLLICLFTAFFFLYGPLKWLRQVSDMQKRICRLEKTSKVVQWISLAFGPRSYYMSMSWFVAAPLGLGFTSSTLLMMDDEKIKGDLFMWTSRFAISVFPLLVTLGFALYHTVRCCTSHLPWSTLLQSRSQWAPAVSTKGEKKEVAGFKFRVKLGSDSNTSIESSTTMETPQMPQDWSHSPSSSKENAQTSGDREDLLNTRAVNASLVINT